MSYLPQPHPVMAVPAPAVLAEIGMAGWLELMRARDAAMRKEKHDPIRYAWEPPIWRVCDCLLGMPWLDVDLARQVREALGFERVVKVLLILGGNRGGKSEYAASRVQKLLLWQKARRAWCLHSKAQMSRDYQQPLLYKYLPAELRKRIRTEEAYISYNAKYGFSDDKYVLPGGSDCAFLNYEMDPDTFEGGELDVIWPDELIGPDLVQTLEMRIATRDGSMVITFTPVRGYTPTVKMFQDGARVVMKSLAYLAPKDEGPPDVARALGLTEAEMAELIAADGDRPKRAAWAPQSRPDDVLARILAGDLVPAMPAGRRFELVPRVAKCLMDESDPLAMQRAIVWFHSSDNPFGNPKSVVSKVIGTARAYVLERFYGVANKVVSGRFPSFDPLVHTVKPDAVPGAGTNCHYVDPSTGRNFYMLWVRYTPDGSMYCYREWPGGYEIPGTGVPGPWALPDGKKHDGKPGPAQDSLGWGFRQYKQEIARLEAWKQYRELRPDTMREEEWVKSWTPEAGTAEPIFERCIDSRFASQRKLEGDRPTTLITEFDAWGLHFLPITGHGEGDNSAIREGTIEINALLAYDEERPVDYFNRPKLYVSEACPNLIYALQNWTGADGNKGACKDPIDTLRYAVQSGHGFAEEETFQSEGGGHY